MNVVLLISVSFFGLVFGTNGMLHFYSYFTSSIRLDQYYLHTVSLVTNNEHFSFLLYCFLCRRFSKKNYV